MKGAILKKDKEGHTYLRKIFREVEQLKDYNWLITDCEAYPKSQEYSVRIVQSGKYTWISGQELYEIVKKDDFQWIWAVLSGFDKQYSLEEVLEYELPYADGYSGFWESELSIQHPLADVELVAWDSSLTLIISKNIGLVEKFRESFPVSEDLFEYNKECEM